ncbi:MAG: hypothetical protein ACOY4U_00840 [Pseudomonadota bacterium]
MKQIVHAVIVSLPCMKSMPMSDKKPADDGTAPAAPAKSAPVARDHGSQR